MRILCSSEYCLSGRQLCCCRVSLPYRCILSYSLSPNVWGSCRSSRAGKLGMLPIPSALYFRLCQSAPIWNVGQQKTDPVSLLVKRLEHLGTLLGARISDIQFMLESIDILPSSSDIIIVLIRIRFSIIVIRSKEEMDSRRLDFGIWVEDGQSDNRDGLGVVPDFLLP
jgi:hypothetical protein